MNRIGRSVPMVRTPEIASKRSRPRRQRRAANCRTEAIDGIPIATYVGQKMGMIFNDGQSPDKHPKCVERMNGLQRECSRSTILVNEFYNQLKKMIKCTLFLHDSRSPFGQNCIEFIIKYLLNFRQTDFEDNEDIEEQRQEFLESILIEAVLPMTTHMNDECRVNACNFIRCLSQELKEINHETFKAIIKALLERTADPKGLVRAASFLALHRFQTVSNDNDLCAQAIYYHLTNDPDPEVRLNCLKVMASSKNSIAYFIGATRDVKDLVRKTAYFEIAQKFDIKSFTIEQRLTILKNGLNDRSLAVRKVVESVLINSWFNSMSNPNKSKPISCDSLVQLLIALDIQTDIDLIEKMVEIHFKNLMEEKVSDGSDKTKFNQLAEDFCLYYLTEQKIFKEKLTYDKVEEVCLWRFLCEFCKNNKIIVEQEISESEKSNNTVFRPQDDIDPLTMAMDVTEEANDCETNEFRTQKIDLFDTLIPDVPIFCEYLENYFQYVCSQDLTINETDALDYEFIFKQLMKLSLLLDIEDDAQRYHLTKALHSILTNDKIGEKFHSHVAPIMKTLAKKAFNDNMAYLDFAAELISEVYSSINAPVVDENEMQENPVELEVKKNLLIAEIEKLKNEVQECETRGNLNEVERLNQLMVTLKADVQALDEKMATNTLSQSSIASQTQTMPSLTDYPNIQIKCLDILCGCLEFGDFGEVNAVMQNHIEKVCLPGFLSEKPSIRCMATRCLGLFCFVCGQYFKQYLHMMIEIFSKDVESVKLMALQSLFDCLCEHGLNIFGAKDSEESQPSLGLSADDQKKDFVKQFNDFFDLQLESNSDEIKQITIQGICKLLLHSKMYSPELLSKLAIIWFTPNQNEAIVQLIGEFLRLYSLAESQGVIIGQSALEEAFLITLQTISDNNLKLDSDRLIRIFLNFIKEDNHISLADKLCKSLLDLEPIDSNKLAEDYLLSAISQLNLVEMENKELKRFDNNVKQIEQRFEKSTSKSKKVEKKLTLIKNNINIRGQQLEADSAFANDFRSEDEIEDNATEEDIPTERANNFTLIRNSEEINENILQNEESFDKNKDNNEETDQNNEEFVEPNGPEPDDPNNVLSETLNDQLENINEENVDQNSENICRPSTEQINQESITQSQIPQPIEQTNSLSVGSDSDAESYRTCPESPECKRRRLSSDRRESRDTRDASDWENIDENAVIEQISEEIEPRGEEMNASEDICTVQSEEQPIDDQIMRELSLEDQSVDQTTEDIIIDQTIEELTQSTTQ